DGQVLEQGGGEGADAEGGGGAGTGGGAADPEEGRLERERLAPSDCQDARGPSGGRGGTSPAPPASHRRSPTRKREHGEVCTGPGRSDGGVPPDPAAAGEQSLAVHPPGGSLPPAVLAVPAGLVAADLLPGVRLQDAQLLLG